MRENGARTVSAVCRAVGARGEFAFYGFALVGTISDRGDFRFRGLVGSLFFIPYKKIVRAFAVSPVPGCS